MESMACLKRAGAEQMSETESLEKLVECLQDTKEMLIQKKKSNMEKLLMLQAVVRL